MDQHKRRGPQERRWINLRAPGEHHLALQQLGIILDTCVYVVNIINNKVVNDVTAGDDEEQDERPRDELGGSAGSANRVGNTDFRPAAKQTTHHKVPQAGYFSAANFVPHTKFEHVQPFRSERPTPVPGVPCCVPPKLGRANREASPGTATCRCSRPKRSATKRVRTCEKGSLCCCYFLIVGACVG